jgi:hypothetical protein
MCKDLFRECVRTGPTRMSTTCWGMMEKDYRDSNTEPRRLLNNNHIR